MVLSRLSIFSSDPAARALIRKLSLLAVGLVSTLCAAYVLLPVSNRLYIASINDKYDMLRDTESPKIVLIGGSSLAFGLDSERVASELGYNVVNTGLHRGLGLRFMLRFVKPHLKAGDVVVFTPEYSLLDDPTPGVALAEALAVFPPGVRYVNPTDIDMRVFLRALQRRFWVAIGFETDHARDVYSRLGFNSYGDLTAHVDAARKYRPTAEDELDINVLLDPRVSHTLNEFHAACSEIGVTVTMSFAPFPEALAGSNEAAMRWKSQLATSLTMNLASDPSDYLFPIEYFYDTRSHLGGVGRQVRTTRLINDLRRFLQVEGVALGG